MTAVTNPHIFTSFLWCEEPNWFLRVILMFRRTYVNNRRVSFLHILNQSLLSHLNVLMDASQQITLPVILPWFTVRVQKNLFSWLDGCRVRLRPRARSIRWSFLGLGQIKWFCWGGLFVNRLTLKIQLPSFPGLPFLLHVHIRPMFFRQLACEPGSKLLPHLDKGFFKLPPGFHFRRSS